MKLFATILAAIAVIIATGQAYLSFKARDDHIESVVAGRRLDACAAVGAAATDFRFRAEAAQASYNAETYQAAGDARRALARASYMAAYLLPEDASQQTARMDQFAQNILALLADRNEGAVADRLQAFDAANLQVQEACRVLIQDSPVAP